MTENIPTPWPEEDIAALNLLLAEHHISRRSSVCSCGHTFRWGESFVQHHVDLIIQAGFRPPSDAPKDAPKEEPTEHEHEFEDRCYCGELAHEYYKPCTEELHSWDYFNSEQVDSYWMRCNLTGTHTEHKNSDTGAHWTAKS